MRRSIARRSSTSRAPIVAAPLAREMLGGAALRGRASLPWGMPHWGTLILVALIWGAFACVGGDANRIDDTLPDLEPTEVLRLGSPDDPEMAFERFDDLRIGPDGNVYTRHESEARILVHAPDGTRLRAIGRPGEGPGEFEEIDEFGFVGDRLWALDFRTYRMARFSMEGEVLRAEALPLPGANPDGTYPPRPSGFFADGSLRGSPLVSASQVREAESWDQPFLRRPHGAENYDTLAVVTNRGGMMTVSHPGGSGTTYMAQPFTDADRVVPFPREAAFVRLVRSVDQANPQPGRAIKITFEGDTVFEVDLPWEPVPILETTIDSVLGLRAESLARAWQGTATAELIEIMREQLYDPGFFAAAGEVVPGHDGSVWVAAEATGAPEREWIVIDPEGTIVGRTSLPSAFDGMDATIDQIWGRELDSLDVPYIVSYEVR